MKFRLLLLILILFPLSAQANVFENEHPLSYIVQKMPELKDIHCKFSQDKFIPTSNIHLKSSGDFSFTKAQGVTFYTTYPVKTTVSYTTGDYKQINNIIKAIANKNYSRLEQDFKFYYEENNSLWNLGLKPKSSSKSAKYIASIEVWGKVDISKIIITTTDKTKTTINFSK